MNGKGANFAVLDVREAIRGVEQQSARRRIQRDGNCVERKVAASQILHDGGPANFRARARAHVVVIARGGKTALAIPGEQQFHVTVFFVFRKDSGASLFQLARHLGGVAFDRKVQIAQRGSGDEIADRASGEIDVEAHGRG